MPPTAQPSAPTRRWRLRRIILAAVLTVVLLLTAGGAVLWFTYPVDTVGQVDFEHEVHIPPLAESTVDDQGRRVFELTAQQGSSDLGGGPGTETWGFNGHYLGPTLRAERGEQVLVNVTNELAETTTVHWHGMHLPASMDGGPHQEIEPGGQWAPTWQVDQPAATLWYHPHPHGHTADHVARGLAGMFLIDDEEESQLPLPRDYGVDDLPVIVQDFGLDENNQLQAVHERGEQILVNGTPGPYAEVSTERVRLRLLNATVQRTFEFTLDDGSHFDQIASDGGLLPQAHRTDHLMLSPGERAEVVITMSPGERRVLRSRPPDLGTNIIYDQFDGGADRFDILQLRADEELEPSPPVPDELAPNILEHAGDPAQATTTRSFELQGRQRINGAQMDMDRIDEVVTVGDTEVWEVINTDVEWHNFHIHDVQFRVLSVDGRRPQEDLGGLKDTIYLPPDVPVELVMTFRHADADVPYMYHCHRLIHEDLGMMGQFVVVEEDQDPGPHLHLPNSESWQRDDGHQH